MTGHTGNAENAAASFTGLLDIRGCAAQEWVCYAAKALQQPLPAGAHPLLHEPTHTQITAARQCEQVHSTYLQEARKMYRGRELVQRCECARCVRVSAWVCVHVWVRVVVLVRVDTLKASYTSSVRPHTLLA